jgi:hypothetical protein
VSTPPPVHDDFPLRPREPAVFRGSAGRRWAVRGLSLLALVALLAWTVLMVRGLDPTGLAGRSGLLVHHVARARVALAA